MNATNYTLELARFAADTTSKSIPESFFLLIPFLILDIFSATFCGFSATSYAPSLEAIPLIHSSSSDGSLPSLDGTNTSLSGVMYLNGIAAASYQYEHVIRHAHPASAVFPALFTVASQHHATREELLTAMAVGYEVSSRIGAASGTEVESERGFHNPAINGQLATAAAIGNLFHWDTETIASAMGVAASSSCGLRAFPNTDAMTKQIHPGHGGALGAEAAFMAKAGLKGPTNILETPSGFLNAFSPEPNATALADGLNETWISEDQIVKLYLMHSTFQVLASAVDRFREDNPWEATDIETVTVYAGPRILSSSHRLLDPTTVDQAPYSAPWCIALAVLRDLKDSLLDFEALLEDQDMQELTRNVEFVDSKPDDPKTLVGRVVVQLTDQTVHNISAPFDSYAGYRTHPDYEEAIKDKYRRVVEGRDVAQEGAELERLVFEGVGSQDVAEIYEQTVKTGSIAFQKLLEA